MEDAENLCDTLEALIFAAPQPLGRAQLRAIMARLDPKSEPEPEAQAECEAKTLPAAAAGARLDAALQLLRRRWAQRRCGFALREVAGGLAFRSDPSHADALRALREHRPQRLSRPALETLAIVAYRQPATKPELDHIRGVDCGGTLKLLLERELVRIVGKKDEPGRPLCYGTTKEFLNLFSLASLQQLPSLRDFVELNEDSEAQVSDKFGQTLAGLSAQVTPLRPQDAEPAMQALHQAVAHLQSTEATARGQLADQGIVLPEADAEPANPGAARP